MLLCLRLTNLYLFLYAILLSHFPPFLSTQQAKGRIAIMPGQYLSHFPCKWRFCFLLFVVIVFFKQEEESLKGTCRGFWKVRGLKSFTAQPVPAGIPSWSSGRNDCSFNTLKGFLNYKEYNLKTNLFVVSVCFYVQEHMCDNGSFFLSTRVRSEGGRCEQGPHSQRDSQKYHVNRWCAIMTNNKTDTSKVIISAMSLFTFITVQNK